MTRTTFFQKNYAGWPPVPYSELANPDSYHWNSEAESWIGFLRVLVGHHPCALWRERIVKSDMIQTWKDLARAAERAFRAAQGGERDLDELVAAGLDEGGSDGEQ